MSRRPKPTDRLTRRSQNRRLSLESLETRDLLTGYTVTSASDSGTGSLRAEITLANADNTLGADSISFAIPGSGVQTIALQSPLPTITRPIVIDATMQPGYSTNNTPVVVLDGSAAGAGANGLTLENAASSVVRGLAIVGFTTSSTGQGGAAIDLQSSSESTLIESDYIGLEADGSTAKANSTGIVVFSANNTIGGSTATAQNVISGNTNDGVLLVGTTATGNLVSGNDIGTNAAGTSAVGNGSGVVVDASSNTIGGTSAGSANVISGNVGTAGTGAGVELEGTATSNVVEGNLIGTNPQGTAALNSTFEFSNGYGIYLGSQGDTSSDNVSADTIGGTVAGSGNLISGNFLGIAGNVTLSLIAGNTVGLGANGTTSIPNSAGILLGVNASTIGGTTASARNLVAGSSALFGGTGTGMDLTGDGDVVEGNYVGLTAGGVSATGSANVVGMALQLTDSTIGGTVNGSGNVISGNLSDGITIGDSIGGTLALAVFGNTIGVDALGNSDPNSGNGINLTIPNPSTTPTTPLTLNVSIGGTAAGSGNTLAENGKAGILVNNNYPTGVRNLAFHGNSIFNNDRLGIDLTGSGTPLPSTLFVTGSSISNGQEKVTGVYFGKPSSTVTVDLFANGADATGYGQGAVFLGSQNLTTNASGFAAFTSLTTAPETAYTSFSATVTDIYGNTSEFSANFPIASSAPKADLEVVTSASSTSVTVGNKITLTEEVLNQGPGTANGVVMSDTLPTTLINTTVVSSVGTASLTNGILSANLGNLASNQFATVTITGTVSQAGSLVDQPGASSTTFDPNYSNNPRQPDHHGQPEHLHHQRRPGDHRAAFHARFGHSGQQPRLRPDRHQQRAEQLDQRDDQRLPAQRRQLRRLPGKPGGRPHRSSARS